VHGVLFKVTVSCHMERKGGEVVLQGEGEKRTG